MFVSDLVEHEFYNVDQILWFRVDGKDPNKRTKIRFVGDTEEQIVDGDISAEIISAANSVLVNAHTNLEMIGIDNEDIKEFLEKGTVCGGRPAISKIDIVQYDPIIAWDRSAETLDNTVPVNMGGRKPDFWGVYNWTTERVYLPDHVNYTLSFSAFIDKAIEEWKEKQKD